MNQDTTNNNQSKYIKKQLYELTPGDIVLHAVYRTDGLLLVNKNKVLSTDIISIIRKHLPSNASVLVSPDMTVFHKFSQNKEDHNTEFINDLNQLVREYNQSVPLQFQRNEINYDNDDKVGGSTLVNSLISSPYWASLENSLESEHLKEHAGHVKIELLALLNKEPTYDNLFQKIIDYGDVILIHSINTACLSILIGITLELTTPDLLDLAIAALFLNIGFTDLPKEEFKSFLKNQEYHHPAMKKHLEIFSLVTNNTPLLRKKSIIHGILDHHEYYNGQGFPNQKKGDEISLFGRILHIAQYYDGLVGGYHYNEGLAPLEAFRIVFENNNTMFDNNILNIFMARTTYFKLHAILHLPSGNKGKIIGFDDFVKHPYLPIIQLDNGSSINLYETGF